MKKLTFCVIILSLLITCQHKTEEIVTKTTPTIVFQEVQEIFKDKTNELFIYKNNTFEWIETENNTLKTIKGNVNYERGFEDDQDATVYILNFDKPSEEQYFVRFSKNDTVIFPLDTNRNKKNAPILYRNK